jgi:AbiV family abortive infection protein
MTDAKHGFTSVEDAIAFGGSFITSAEDFNAALDHVARLLDDAVMLYERGSYGSAAFLAITALEETAKAHIGIFRRDDPDKKPMKGRDPFRDHKSKHSMAVLPTLFMSERIMTALGADRANSLRDEAHATGFIAVREAGLYCVRLPTGFVSPKEAVTKLRAWEFLMLAIEAADDALVGCTNHSYEVGKQFDAMFARLSGQRPEAQG